MPVPPSSSRLRIAVDMRRMHNTGIGRYARNILSCVTREGPQHEYLAVVQDEADAGRVQALAPGTRCVVAPARQYSFRELLRAPDLPAPIDVWHSPHPFHWGVGARHRTVLTVLDLTQLTHAIGLRNLALREPIRAVLWTACRRADRFVAISATTREQFHRGMGIAREKIHVTPLAPDARFADAVDPAQVAAARARWALSGRVVLYVGMTQPHKNLARLLEAMALLGRDDGEPARLAIVGPVVADERVPLHARIRELGIEGQVRFLDWLSDDEVRLAYHMADVLVQPSLSEGFGLTVLEAMQCGTPCVVSDLPVLREVAGSAALFVDPLNPAAIAGGLRAVLADPVRARELRALGRDNAAQFSWRRAARETLAAYEAAVGSGPSRA